MKNTMSNMSTTRHIETIEVTQKAKCLSFPKAAQLADIYCQVNDGMIIRNNVQYRQIMTKLSLYTHPTQMCKLTLFELAEKVCSKTETAPVACSMMHLTRFEWNRLGSSQLNQIFCL
jgi:hypothetical protein